MSTNPVSPNIIWIVTDSARNFSTGGLDDRDRPEFFDEIAPDFVNFKNAVTSAPSSVMSGACMLTGMNSYYVGRNYDDFRYEEGFFPNLPSILKDRGYESNSIFVAREMREKIAPFIGAVDRRFWPKNLSHSQRMWTNSDANIVFENFLESRDNNPPLFFMLWNNIRHDLEISQNLRNLTELLKKYGYYENSVIIFSADHGYPHPRRGFTPEYLKREGLTHDMMLGDDNILIPLLIKAPHSKPRDIGAQVGTVDLFPTILDYVGIKDYSGKGTFPQSGFSLRPLLDGSDDLSDFSKRPLRCDCRFFGQSDRKTAIRRGSQKYVYSHDDGLEEFFDVLVDPSEDVSLADREENQAAMEELRTVFLDEERKANDFQRNFIARRLANSINGSKIKGDIVIFSSLEKQLNDCVLLAFDALSSKKGPFHVSALVGEIDAKSSSIVIHNISIEEGRNLLLDPIRETIAATTPTAIVLRSSVERRHDNIAHIMSELNIIPAREFDINFESTNSIQWGAKRYLNAIWSRRHVIRREPSIVFTYAKELLARKLKRFKQ